MTIRRGKKILYLSMLRRLSRLNSGISLTDGGRNTSPDEGAKLARVDRNCVLLIAGDCC